MASVAIDVLDLNWRILQEEKKPLTPRGRARLRRKRRSRRDIPEYCRRLLKRNGGQLRREGPRHIALEKANGHEVLQQLEEMVGEDASEPSMLEFRDDYGEYEEERLQADLLELDPETRERAILLNIESQQRHAKARHGGTVDICARRRFLKDLVEDLERRVANGADATTEAFLTAQQLELFELESVLYAA